MKKKIIFIIIPIILILAVAISLLILTKEEPPIVSSNQIVQLQPVPTKNLDSPRKLNISNGILTWQAVDNASSYIVRVGDDEYLSTTNMFNLSLVSKNQVFISVRALGLNGYIDSINSIERFYVLTIDENEIEKMKTQLCEALIVQNDNELSFNLEKKIKEIVTELYLEGVTSKDIDYFLKEIEELRNIATKESLELDGIGNQLYKILDNDLSDYGNILLIKSIAIMMIENYKELNSDDQRFDVLLDEINNLTADQMETLSITIRYLRDMSELVNEQGELIIDQLLMVLQNDIQESSAVNFGFDFVALKDQIIQNLMLELPTESEYNSSVEILSELYGCWLPKDMSQYNLIEVFEYAINDFYLSQHRTLSILEYFNNEHFEKLIVILKNLYDSFGGKSFEDKILELYNLYQEQSYDEFLDKVLIYGLTENGQLDNSTYTELKEGILKLNDDILNENYEYLEQPLTNFCTELFKYLSETHDASILVNPLIAYLTKDGSYLEHLFNQFTVLEHIRFVEGKTILDLYNVVCNFDESDLEFIKSIKDSSLDLKTIIETLGLNEIIEIDYDKIQNVGDTSFIVHFTGFLNELRSFDNLMDKVNCLFNHFDINNIIIPLIKQLLVELDEPYALNIDYEKFLMNFLVNVGVDVGMLMLKLNEFSNFMNNFELTFDAQYNSPQIEIVVPSEEEIETAIKENIMYLIFGMDSTKFNETVDNFIEDLPFIIEQLEEIYKDIEIDKIIELLEEVELSELLKDYEIDSKYIEQLEQLIDEIINDIKNNRK